MLDLGANVGFFTLRLIDTIVRERGPDVSIRATLIEGSPACYAELQYRLSNNPLVQTHVRIEHGLVGQRSGSATIFQHAFHAANSVNNPTLKREGKGTEVRFIDVSALTQDMPRIHLLKCDIEGSELSFLENYPDLLDKVDSVVMELHPDLCDVDHCRQILTGAGLTRRTVIRKMPDQSVEFFEQE